MRFRGKCVLWVLVCLIPASAASQPPDLTYHTVPTCVAVHTAVTGGAFAANEIRTYNVAGDGSFASQGGSSTGCGVPGFSNGIAQVQAVELNVVAYTPTGSGYLKVYPAGQPVDRAMLFYTAGNSIADTGAAAVAQTAGGDITIQATAPTHVIVKVVGYYTKAVQTVFVHPVPGDNTASGTRLINALAAITDASATKRYVIKIEPGIYDVGTTGLQMKDFVDLEGSGQEATVIRGEGGSAEATAGVVMGAASSEIRDLQVKAEGTQQATVAIRLPHGGCTSIRDVTIFANGPQATWGIRSLCNAASTVEGATITTSAAGSADGYGIGTKFNGTVMSVKRTVIKVSGGTTGKRYGISAFTGATVVEIRDVQVDVSGGLNSYGVSRDTEGFGLSPSTTTISGSTVKALDRGVAFDGQQLNIEHSAIRATATAGYGIEANGAVIIDHSEVTGNEATVQAVTASIGATRLNGGAVIDLSSATCAGVYDESFTFYASTCP